MKRLFAKILMVACLALLLGLKALTLLSAGEMLFIHAPHHKAANEYSLAAQHTVNDGHKKRISRVFDKSSLHPSAIFEDDNASKGTLKKEHKIRLKKVFASLANYAFSSRTRAFFKSYSIHLAVTEHHAPLYDLGRALLI